MSTPIAVDASVIVRFLTDDDKVQSAAAADLFRAAQAGQARLVIPTATVQETVYVLERLYKLDAATIATKLISLLALPNVESPDARWVMEALQFYRTKNSDFGDALLCAYAHGEGLEVATFDKGIPKKFHEVTAYPPTEWQRRHVPAKSKGDAN